MSETKTDLWELGEPIKPTTKPLEQPTFDLASLAQKKGIKSTDTIGKIGIKDPTGLGGGGLSPIKTIPDHFKKAAEKYGWDAYSIPEDAERIAFLGQDSLGLFGNAAGKFGLTAVAGFLEDYAATDPIGMANTLAGTNSQRKAGNWLNDIAKDVRNVAEEEFTIYKDGDNMMNGAYWADLIGNSGNSGGMMAAEISKFVALNYITGGAASASLLPNLFRTGSLAGKMFSTGTVLTGVQQGFVNAHLNSWETAEKVKQKFLDLDYSEKNANIKGAQAATYDMRTQLAPQIALGVLQMGLLFGKGASAVVKNGGLRMGASDAFTTLAETVLPQVENKFAKTAIGFGVEGFAEAGEEFLETASSKYAQGIVTKEKQDYLDVEARDSFVGGFVGSIFSTGMARSFGKFSNLISGTDVIAKRNLENHDTFVNNTINSAKEIFFKEEKLQKNYQTALQNHQENNTLETEAVLNASLIALEDNGYNKQLQLATRAMQLDYITGKDTAFKTHIETMEELLTAANSGGKGFEVLKQHGLIDENGRERVEGSLETVRNTYEETIKNSKDIKAMYDKNIMSITDDNDVAIKLAQAEFKTKMLNEKTEELKQDLNTLYEVDDNFKKLSLTGQNRFKIESELAAYDRLPNLTENDKIKKEELKKELETLEQYNSEDLRIFPAIKKETYVAIFNQFATYKQVLENKNKELAEKRSPESIKKAIEERKEAAIQEAKTLQEAKEAIAKAQKDKELSDDLAKKAAKVLSDLSAQEQIREILPDLTIEPENTIKEKPNSKKETETSDAFEKLQKKELVDKSEEISEEEYNQVFSAQSVNAADLEQMSPRGLEVDKISEAKKERVRKGTEDYIKELEQELEKEITFENFIRDRLERTGLENAEKSFEAYKYAWGITGREVPNSVEIYNKFFDVKGRFEDLAQSLFSQEEFTEETKKTIKAAIAKEAAPTSFDESNVPNDSDANHIANGKTSNPAPKAAYLGVEYIDVTNDDGSVTRHAVSPQLNNDKGINNNFILDPNYITEGKELEVVIPENFENLLVANWTFSAEKNKWVRKDILFKDWCLLNNVAIGSPAYNNKIPMVAVFEGNPVFYLHDADWYNTENIDSKEQQKETIIKGKTEIINVRKAIIAGQNKIIIDSRKFGSLFSLTELRENSEPIPLNEATGETILAVATSHKQLANSLHSDVGSKIILVNNLSKTQFRKGQLYEIRKISKDKYIALAVLTNNMHSKEDINDTAYNNVKFAVIASVVINAKGNSVVLNTIEKKYGITLAKAEAIQSAILESSKYDIKTEISKYMSLFVSVESKESKDKLNQNLEYKLSSKEKNAKGNSKYPMGTNYISVDGNVIKIVLKDGNATVINEKGFDTHKGINLNAVNEKSIVAIIKILEKNFEGKEGAFRKTHFDVSVKKLGQDNKFTKISETGEVILQDNSTYEDYVKSSVKTEIKSFEITDAKGNKKWITDVQPMVYYSLKSELEKTPEVSSSVIPEVALVAPIVTPEPVVIQQNETKPEVVMPAVQFPIIAPVVEQALTATQENFYEAVKTAMSQMPDNLKEKMKNFMIEGLPENDGVLFSRREFTKEQLEMLQGLNTNAISTLTPIQQKILVDSIFKLVLANISTNKNTINLNEVLENINSSVETYLEPKIKELEEMRQNLTELNNPVMEVLINNFTMQIERLKGVIEEKAKLISQDKDNKGDLHKKFEKFFTEEIEEIKENKELEKETKEDEKSYSKSALEKNIKLSFSNSLKIMFAGIKKQNPKTKQDNVNFAYLNDFENADDIISSLVELMIGLPSSYEHLIAKLETKKSNPSYAQILQKIKNASEQTKNEILYKMIQSKLDMRMVQYSFDTQTGASSLKIINSNSSDLAIQLKLQWVSNYLNLKLFRKTKEGVFYDKIALQELINKINAMQKNQVIDVKNVKAILLEIGINLEQKTLEEYISTVGIDMYGSSGILGIFNNNLKGILINNKETEQIELKGNNPFENSRGVLSKLIELEIEMSGNKVSKSFRVGGKILQGTIQKMMAYDIKDNLKNLDSDLIAALSDIPYSKNNYILELLKTDDVFRHNYNLSFVSLEAMKQNVEDKIKTDVEDKKITKLPLADNMISQLAFFSNLVKTLSPIKGTGINMRMGDMFNPSLSDKDQMLLQTTALLDLNYKNFEIRGNEVKVNKEILSFMTEQIFSAEFDRIISTYLNPTDIKNYDDAAKRFLSIPAFNDIMSEETDIHTLIQQIISEPNKVEGLKEKLKPLASKVIENVLQKELESKVDVKTKKGFWYKTGIIGQDPQGNQRLKFIDAQYLKSKKLENNDLTTEHLAQIAALDFIVNQFLNQNNVYQLVLGDMALFAPSIKKHTSNGKIDNVGFSKAIGSNVTKRVAMLIAPGFKLANSHGDSYIQIFVNDPIKMTSSGRDLIRQCYGEVSKRNEELLSKLESIENKIENLYKTLKKSPEINRQIESLKEGNKDSKQDEFRAGLLSLLAEENPEIGGYFDIEGTDAQEYTTWKEHLDILFRQGRLSDENKVKLQIIYNKLEKREILDAAKLKTIMNLLKPVCSGTVIERNAQGKSIVNRTIYIKSASFPLLPQLTTDFKLDKIRMHMEALQSKTGKNVRLSYQTANKIGAVNTKLTVDDLYNTDFETLYEDKLKNSILELDRNNFKIQQDNPYKTEKYLKKNENDMTTMASQIWKVLLSNGVISDNKIFPNLFENELLEELGIVSKNNMLSGKDLNKIKFEVEKMYYNVQRDLLYDKLKFNRETGKPFNRNESIKAIHKMLVRETTIRQYPESIVDGLRLIKDGKNNIDFMLPIWLSNGANKFESLLQSIITDKLIKSKLPGTQHISASSEGFERVASLNNLSENTISQIVWVNPSHTGELKATTITSTGELKESECLVQSKFMITETDEKGKKTSELIDLTKLPYSKIVNGQYVLNQDMINESLLSSFSFRIPTSSHQSGAILKVVGFLPESSGDLLVVPKEHTKQIGEDYDVDKRTLYKSNYYITETGKIEKLKYNKKTVRTDSPANKKEDINANIKMFENVLIDVYKSVYSTTDNEMQKKINKILSFEKATQVANLMEERLNSTADETYFSSYSDNYQRGQMKLGADGQFGTGGHSNAVTFEAQLERLFANKTPVEILKANVYDGKIFYEGAKYITVGNQTSNGILGSGITLDEERSVGDVHTENQNSSVDNIKAQIMGKRNENQYTLNVLVQLTNRGFDLSPFFAVKLKDGNLQRFKTQGEKNDFISKNSNLVKQDYNNLQISSLFINQPIIRKYVELMEQSKSITYVNKKGDLNKEILEQLLYEFGGTYEPVKKENGEISAFNFMKEGDYDIASSKMTADVLYDNLINDDTNKTWSSEIQLAVLQKFHVLNEEAKELNQFQQLINLSTSGLGMSYFDVLERIKMLDEIGKNKSFKNIKHLVGDFKSESEIMPLEIRALIKQGYELLGENYIKATTTEGTTLINSVKTAQDIMSTMFPYEEDIIQTTIKKIIKERKLTKNAKNKIRYKVISYLKDFINSQENIGFFEGDVNSERARLFMDTATNTSLGTYLKLLKNSKYKNVFQNELLKSLSFTKVLGGDTPAVILHVNDYASNFDKTDKYTSFMELLQDDTTDLGVYNGEQMTPRKLAQDLASYAYLSNTENGAIGFKDFVNIEYLNLIGVAKNLRNFSLQYANTETFIKQYYQHEPQEALKFTFKFKDFQNLNEKAFEIQQKYLNLELAGKEIPQKVYNEFYKALTYFDFVSDNFESSYYSFKDDTIKNTDNNWRLFVINDIGQGKKIPTLGAFGVNEFDANNPNQRSMINPETGADIYDSKTVEKLQKPVNVASILGKENTIESLFEQIAKSRNTKYAEFAKTLMPFVDTNTKVIIGEYIKKDGKVAKTGIYLVGSNEIYIHPNILSNLDVPLEEIYNVMEEVLLEEMIHSLVAKNINKFGTESPAGIYTPYSDAPPFVFRLAKLYSLAKKQFPNEHYTKDINEFIAGMFVDERFAEKMDNAIVNGKSLFEMFKDVLSKMINYVTNKSYSEETKANVYELLQYTKEDNKVKLGLKKISKTDTIVTDLKLEQEINEIVGVQRANITNKVDVKNFERYDKRISEEIIKSFKEGKSLVFTPFAKRSEITPEYFYMRDLVRHILADKPQGTRASDFVNIKDINSETQEFSKKENVVTTSTITVDNQQTTENKTKEQNNNESYTEDDYDESGISAININELESPRNTEFRLPTIKKC